MCIYIYICVFVCVCVCQYMYCACSCVCVCVCVCNKYPSNSLDLPWYKRRSYIIGEASPYCSKGKAIPLQAWTGPKGSRRLRLPDFKTIGT